MARRDKYGSFDVANELLNAVVLAGATATVSLDTEGYDQLTVVWQLMGTVTTTDITSQGVKPYRADGTTLILQNLPAVRTVALASDGTNVITTTQYDVRGIPRVRIQAVNSNVGNLTMVITAFLGASPVS